jgi:hypothetical protein
VIDKLIIQNLRGIRKADLRGLTPLTVLVGPNGAGKSTVLDAALIALSSSPGDVVGRSIKRRLEVQDGSRWLFFRSGSEATVGAAHDDRVTACSLSWSAEADADLSRLVRSRGAASESARQITTLVTAGDSPDATVQVVARTVFSPSNYYRFDLRPVDPAKPQDVVGFRRRPDARLVVPFVGATHAALHDLYTQAVEQGRLEEVLSILRSVLPGAHDLRILTAAGAPLLHVELPGYSVPVAACGDGVYSAVRVSLELAVRPAGVVLIEEPEAHQHPAALLESSKAIVGAARRGVQVVLSTHSLELIDALLAQSVQEGDAERLSVVRMRLLPDGELAWAQILGGDVAFEREHIGEDLR